MTGFSSGGNWDEDCDEYSGDEYSGIGFDEVFEAFADYLPTAAGDSDGDSDIDPGDGSVITLLSTATNPAHTVSVTSLLSGRVFRVELAPDASNMTEVELAAQIKAVASLSNQQARAAQHAVIATVMDRLGRDPSATRSFLERELALPSLESVNMERGQMFSDHYSQDRE